jgi:adenylyl-sulfate kinase
VGADAWITLTTLRQRAAHPTMSVVSARSHPSNPDVVWHESTIDRAQRWARTGVAGGTVWFTGLSGSGKSTLADAVAGELHRRGRPWYVLDGDNIRHGLNADLGFDAADRAENVRRVGEVARLMADAGLVVLVPLISPYREGRDLVRAAHEAAALPFCEVHLDIPLEVCETRDPKGLYAKARAGDLPGFTGVDDPYEAPLRPEIRSTAERPLSVAAGEVLAWIDSFVQRS